jgi:chaperonin cofactor prefoldin
MEREQEMVVIACEALDEILNLCGQALSERDRADEGSAEWHKRTGEVLAYAKMTSVLDKLERCCTQNVLLTG